MDLQKGIKNRQERPYYEIVANHSTLPLNQALLNTMEQRNKDGLQNTGGRLAEAGKGGQNGNPRRLASEATYLTEMGDKVRQSLTPRRSAR